MAFLHIFVTGYRDKQNRQRENINTMYMFFQKFFPYVLSTKIFLVINFIFLEQFKVHSKTEEKIKRFLIYCLPHPCIASQIHLLRSKIHLLWHGDRALNTHSAGLPSTYGGASKGAGGHYMGRQFWRWHFHRRPSGRRTPHPSRPSLAVKVQHNWGGQKSIHPSIHPTNIYWAPTLHQALC